LHLLSLPMFFILSKLLIYVLNPVTWIFILFIAGFIVKDPKRKMRFFLGSFAVLIIFSNPFLLNQFAKRWDVPPQHLPDSGKYSCAILLGGFAGEDYKEGGYFTGGADRFIQSVKLKVEGKVSHILMSGGSANLIDTKFREADFVISQLKALNIPDSAILLENQSRNTLENAEYSKKLLDSLHLPPPYLLVTSGYHMPRALYIYKKKGLNVIPFPCNYIAGRDKTSVSSFIPSVGTLGGWEFYIKEVVGLSVYKLK
jgi:uncharacterized SAM-binding protein YcdF (DUF218 family)